MILCITKPKITVEQRVLPALYIIPHSKTNICFTKEQLNTCVPCPVSKIGPCDVVKKGRPLNLVNTNIVKNVQPVHKPCRLKTAGSQACSSKSVNKNKKNDSKSIYVKIIVKRNLVKFMCNNNNIRTIK